VLNLDPAKLLIIAVVAVILLGPDRLPQVARQAGAAWRTFNDFRHRMENEVRSSIPDLPSSTDIARLARSPTALLNHLSNLDLAPDGPEGAAEEAASGASVGTSADHPGYEPSTDATIPAESAKGSSNGSSNGSANGHATGHPPTISVPPTSTFPTPTAPPSAAPAPGPPRPGAGQPVDPSLN
jgi:sec-independent protein translocase protein TatB